MPPPGLPAIPRLHHVGRMAEALDRRAACGNIRTRSPLVNRRRPPPPEERRSGADRRKVDKGPPGGRERRVTIEPRKPDVREVELTPSEWAALTAPPSPAAPSADGPAAAEPLPGKPPKGQGGAPSP